MAMEVAMEDDLFFADLNRQITLLIDDDEDDQHHVSHLSFISPQNFSRTIIHPPIILPSQYNLYNENCGNQMSKGTGVFIPQLSQQRRRYKQQGRRTGAKSNPKQFVNNPKSRSNNNNNGGAYPTSINRR